MSERPKPLDMALRIERFTNLQPHQGVNNFVIKGPLQEDGTLSYAAAAIFAPDGYGASSTMAIIKTSKSAKGTAATYYAEILKLEMSRRIVDLQIPDIPMVKVAMTDRCALNGWPVLAITFGTYERSGDPVVTLYSIVGYSPQTALREFQNRSRERMAKLS